MLRNSLAVKSTDREKRTPTWKGNTVLVISSQKVRYLLLVLFFCSLSAVARTARVSAPAILPVSESEQLRSIVGNLLQDNDEFVKSRSDAYFKPLAAGQAPRATVVTCSDSRVHTHALDKTPDGDLFMIRNIGNQLHTAEGSVEYGVHHLHTPLLIFIGHSSCGAIKAVSGNYSRESRAIKRELDSIRITKGMSSMDGVRTNVNNQVAAAMKKFSHEVKRGELTVIGAVYDFTNDYGQGYGKLNIVNLNGETNRTRIQFSKLLTGVIMDEKPKTVKIVPINEGGEPQARENAPGSAAYSFP